MLQLPFAEIDTTPGNALEWRVRSTTARPDAESPPPQGVASYNQREGFAADLDVQEADEPVFTYEVVTFEIPGPLDRPALESALLHFVRRHDVLRCTFQQLAGDLTCHTLEPDAVALERVDAGHFPSADALRTHLLAFFRRIDALTGPLFVMGAVVRDASTTVHLAFHHLVTDGMSAPIAVRDVATAYAAYARGQRPALPEAGSYLDFSRDQQRRHGSMAADDPRLDHWKSFMARNGDFFPAFPLDLGLEPGRMYPTANETHTLLDPPATDAMEARCRAAGGGLFTGLLAAVGVATRREGGPDTYRALMPVSGRDTASFGGPDAGTAAGRTADAFSHTMGWFAKPVPVEFSVDHKEFTDALAHVRAATAAMRAHADVPYVMAQRLLAPQYSTVTAWPFAINLLSYLDFGKTQGAEHHTEWNARSHVWAPQQNGICLYFHRNSLGLRVNSLYADTPQARRTQAALQRTLIHTLENIAHSGTL